MTSEQSDNWIRPDYTPGGGDAYLLYAVFGEFPQPIPLPLAKYRTRGLPEDVNVVAYARADQEEVVHSLYAGWLRKILQAEQSDLFAVVESAPVCLLLRGTVADPPTLDYLRNVIGVLTALLDKGAVAILDSQTLTWFARQEWLERIFDPDAPVPTHHVGILLSEEEDEGRVWVHTRGMRKFGRPDLSVRDVSPEYQDACIELCNRFIALQAFGGQIPEGQPIHMRGLPPGLICRHQGDYDDPDFNNVHIEIRMLE